MAEIDWSMSAALENVERGDSEVPEVTSLAGAVHAWAALDTARQKAAVLTPERPIDIDGESISALSGQSIQALADRLGAFSTPLR